MKKAFFALGAALLGLAAPADAQNVRPQDPGSVVQALKNGGYEATLGTDGVGDPMITSKVAGTTYQLFFYNCANHLNCATVEFHSAYHRPRPITLDEINQWNSSQRFGRAYLDKEGDPVLAMDVDLDHGGVSAPLFIDNVEFWASVLPKFEQLIGYRK